MTDGTEEIRDLLARAVSDAPGPHPWSDVEDRAARPFDAPAPSRRRTGVWLGAAACTIALLGGLVAVLASDEEPNVRTDDLTGTTVNTAPSTSAPAPTTTLSWTGGLLDDIDVDALRPLDSFTAGDAIVPTAPGGWRVFDFPGPQHTASQWSVEVGEAPPDGSRGQILKLMTTTEATCLATRCRPSGDTVTINGVEWEAIAVPGEDRDVFDVTYLRAPVGDRWVSVLADPPDVLSGPLLENPLIVGFLEGLRAGSPQVVETIGEACLQCAVFGKDGDPFADASRSGTAVSQSDGDPTDTSEGPVEAPSGADPNIGRPLAELATGDVIVPTYIPPGRTLNDAKIVERQGGSYSFSFLLEQADTQPQWTAVSLYQFGGTTLGPLGPQFLDDPDHPPVDIAGVTWGWNDFEKTRVARFGPNEVMVKFDLLERSEAKRFIEGLRAVRFEQFPVAITSEGIDG